MHLPVISPIRAQCNTIPPFLVMSLVLCFLHQCCLVEVYSAEDCAPLRAVNDG